MMLLREENSEKRTGQQIQAAEKEGQKPLRKTLIGKCSRKTNIFTAEELRRFFNPEIYGDQDLYLFYLCCLTAGLRPGEARGLCPRHILFDKMALMVDGFIRKNEDRTSYNEKLTGGHMKLRIAPLPDMTLRLLKEHIERKGLKDDDFIFAAKKDPPRPITEYYIHGHIARIIEKAGIQPQGRKLTVQSFRLTCATYMRQEIPAGIVMKLIGHRIIGMTEYYHKSGIDECLAGLTGADTAIQKLLNKAE
jgi:integrase